MNSDSKDCTTDEIHPFVVTVKTWEIFWDAMRNNPWLGSDNCYECCVFCFPCTIAIDLVTLVPFSGIYFGKKCCKYCKKVSVIPPVTPIVTQPAKMPTLI